MQTSKRAPRDRTPIDWGDQLRKLAIILAKFGGLAFAVCLAYFAYAIFGGVMQSADPTRAASLIKLFGTALVASSLCLALGIVVLTIEELAYSIIVAIGGVALMLGIPYLVASQLSSNLTGNMRGVVSDLSGFGFNAGIAVLVVVGLRILFEIAAQVREGPDRRRVRAEKEESEDTGVLKKRKTIKPTTVFSPCWELPFCHERIREICPAYKARKACWRYGIGCNCDPKLIESLIRMGQPGHGPQDAAMRGRQAAYVRSDLQADVVVGDKAQRTISCAKCPIYNEHQRLKFKVATPMAIIGTVAAMGVLYEPIMIILTGLARGIAQVATNISMNQRVDAGQWFAYLNTPGIRVFFFIILGLLALSYVLRFTEWVVLVKKL